MKDFFDDFSGIVHIPRGAVEYENGVLVERKEKPLNKKPTCRVIARQKIPSGRAIDRKEKKMKKLFITLGRERDLIRYSEKSDLKDAKEISEEDAVSLFQKNFYSEEKAREFIESVKDNPFNNWCQWR